MTQGTDLVIGAGGKVGAAVAAELRRRGATVVTTGRRGDDADLILDFEYPDYAILPTGVARAYICAAMPGADACAEEPERTFTVNVETPVELTRRLSAAGAFVINLSSTQIFSGAESAVPPDAAPEPSSVYGRHKAILEQRLREQVETPGAIVRISKVLTAADPGILGTWRTALAAGHPVLALQDCAMSPVTLRQAVDALLAVAYGPWEGVTQVSAPDEISYFDAALLIARIVGASPDLVKPVLAAAIEGTPPPRHAGLDCRVTESRQGWQFAGARQVIEETLGVET